VPLPSCTASYRDPKPISISRRIALERDGLGSGWRSIQAVIAASNSAERRTVLTGSLPVAGRPRPLFCISAIDPPLNYP
jgi:hypothetical protein